MNKKRWFKLLAFTLPFLLLLFLELFLRLWGYGQDYSLFVEDEQNPGDLVMNPFFSEKYFTEKQNATVGFFERFGAEKEEGTFRIFVMGASTAVGFPYLHNGSFHRMLRHRLEHTYPDTRFEVINLALTAINSYALQDMAEEIIQQKPDAVLIYAGHNEYYGALGVGSSSQLGSFPALIRLALKLRDLRLMQLFYNLYFSLRELGQATDPDLKENLMKRMVREQEIPYQSEIYHAGLKQFEENMDILLSKFKSAGLSVYLSKLVSNEKDQPPFISKNQEGIDLLAWTTHYEEAERAYHSGHFDLALKEALLAEQIDKSHAGLQFLLGSIYSQLGTTKEALKAYKLAREYDLLRFRAPLEINAIIDKKAKKYAAKLVNTDITFRNESINGILGDELFLEHLHPNLQGYSLMAEAFYKKLTEEPILPNPQYVSLAEARETYPLTEVDSLYGIYATQILKQGWPFMEKIETDSSSRTLPEAIAGALVVKQLNREQAMEKLYQHYHHRDVYDSALRVLEAVILEYPDKAEFYAKAGSLSMRIKNFRKGHHLFNKAFALEPNPRLAYYAGLCLVQQGELSHAANYLLAAPKKVRTEPDAMRLLTAVRQILLMEKQLSVQSQNTKLLSQLAKSYYLIGLAEKARKRAQWCLQLSPGHAEAAQLLRQIEQQENS